MEANEIIYKVARRLQDEAGTSTAPTDGLRWTTAQLADYSLEAFQDTQELIGAVSMTSVTLTTVTGVGVYNLSTLQPGFERLIRIQDDTGTPIYPKPSDWFDSQYMTWRTDQGRPQYRVTGVNNVDKVEFWPVPDTAYVYDVTLEFNPTALTVATLSVPSPFHKHIIRRAAAIALQGSNNPADRSRADEETIAWTMGCRRIRNDHDTSNEDEIPMRWF